MGGKLSLNDRVRYRTRGYDDGFWGCPMNKNILMDKEASRYYKEGYYFGCLDAMRKSKEDRHGLQ